ncbi:MULTISPECIES: PAS domain-containing hybrid sensor histidine kinase/response regulator [Paraburkholderia]|uniref:histidine kinase n=1 Tax=Paraburkholderia tropica TaxID=92647 RepID=A0AAQ1GLD4_9BURK|nr:MULTISPECIES: PAS domain S-box protein [Paraburkholderia]MBB3003114.1 PAS domain S-box-containing protein [Paraburkholderia tropica]MBB6322033.1 PAS domain S-box-containing protein [Paraburkholderia tropica]MDE1138244.1 PAS domain S-box protein [Paraburkholderia tropica]PXX12680.1 PAS/PAC sensor hybrid histidine kinase [Paraburkholderia tropica]PZW77517.1 PAS/PAC sensor hybrid histidine kinase [Paraburkholderia tropica]
MTTSGSALQPDSGLAAEGHSGRRFEALVQPIEDYAIFLLDPRGYVVSWNNGAARIKGYEAHEIIGQHFSRFYTDEANGRRWPEHELEQAALHGRFNDEGWRVRKDGSMFWANVVITALREQDGSLAGFAKVTRDLTAERRQVEALRLSEERFRLLVESVSDYAIFMLDPQGRVVSWNSGATNLKGYRPAEIVGQHFSVFYPPEEAAAGAPERELRRAAEMGRCINEGWRVRKDGSMFWANVTLTAIHDMHGRLTGFAKVTRDMTESRRTDELEHSSEQMKQFLAMLAHELRNPLAPVRNAIATMRLMPGASPEIDQARDLIDRQIVHLTRLVDDLLDVGRITSGKIELREAPLDLCEVMRHAVDAARPFTAARRQRVDVHMPDAPIAMTGDHTRLVQVLQNLLHNASKFSPDESRIVIDTQSAARTVQIQVRDEGRGLRPDTFESIFGLFSQDRSMPGPSENGLGIGLMLCRSLIELHGGTISAASDGPGMGSTFTIRLPLSRASAQSAGANPLGDGLISTVEPIASAHDAAAPLRVLVVDDNRDSADSLAMLLELKGHDVRVAYSATQARECVSDFTPDAALIDIAMPEIDGYAALRFLRAHPPLAHTLFAAMTGFGQAADVELTRAAGFEMHLVKPVDAALFDELLARAAVRRAALAPLGPLGPLGPLELPPSS